METIAAAVIAALAALGGVWLEKLSQGQADKRRWDREDTARRRLRGEDAAAGARKALHEATALFDASWQRAKGRSGQWEYPAHDALEDITGRALEFSIEIPDDSVRLFVRNATIAILFADEANQGGSIEPWELARAVAAESDAVIGAYRRGEHIPQATEIDAAVSAAGRWRAQIDAYYAQKQAESKERRSAKERE